MSLTALVLCGGKGTRLQSIAADQPKLLVSIAGRPYVEYLFRYLRTQCVSDIVLCTGHLAERIVEYCGDGSRWGVAVRYSQEDVPLGTGGAVKHAHALAISDPFWLVNGDTLVGADLEEVYASHVGTRASGTLVLAEVPDVSRFGTVVTGGARDGWILSFNEKGGVGKGLVNAGLYLMTRSVVGEIPSGRAVSLEVEILPGLVQRGLRGTVARGPFIDIGTDTSLREAHKVASEWFSALDREAS
jgi:NDP-sugar pyrophosphorylase family protein